jgi:thiamine pyrophosphate-dependent acetolactate synthase large subunit-like protein
VSGVAEGYGLRARRVEGRDELGSALRDAIASRQPEVVEVQVAPGMTLG